MGIKIGDKIPNFKLNDTKGNSFDSQSLLGKPTVIYFYPKDNTAGCTAQACSFRDSYEDFKDLGAEVVGISSDSVSTHENFSKQYKLPFLLLSDSTNKVRKLFGVPSAMFGLVPGRVTYVADKEGVIKMIFDSMMPKNHISNALKAVRKM